MSTHDIEMPLSKVPLELIERISNTLHSWSTTLIKLRERVPGEPEAIPIGSGTFVSIGQRYGILTAQHVAELIERGSTLGLTVVSEEHRFTVEAQFLHIHHIARGTVEAEGPDLSFIELPYAKVPHIRAHKQFVNLDALRREVIERPKNLQTGIWFLCGTPNINTSEYVSERGHDHAMFFRGLCGAGGVSETYVVGQFDYIHFDIEYATGDNIPRDFGGMSGAGLWQVTVVQSRNGKLSPGEFIYTGVAFYQSEIIENKRFIKCHGPSSIYQVAFDEIAGLGDKNS